MRADRSAFFEFSYNSHGDLRMHVLCASGPHRLHHLPGARLRKMLRNDYKIKTIMIVVMVVMDSRLSARCRIGLVTRRELREREATRRRLQRIRKQYDPPEAMHHRLRHIVIHFHPSEALYHRQVASSIASQACSWREGPRRACGFGR
jgi:hypothetical protein